MMRFLMWTLALLMTVSSPAQLPAQARPEGQSPRSTFQFAYRFEAKDQLKPIPYETVGGLVMFKAVVSGREVWALLDNGADVSILDADLARSLEIEIGEKTGKVNTPAGPLPIRLASDVPVSLPGNLHVRSSLFVADLSSLSARLTRKVDIVIGYEYFGNFAFILDAQKRTLIFVPSGAARPPASEIAIPLTIDGKSARIKAEVNGSPVVLTLDLGSNGVVTLARPTWQRAIPSGTSTKRTRAVYGNGLAAEGEETIAPKVTIAGVVHRDLPISVEPVMRGEEDGRLGIGFFKGAQFALDMKAGKLWARSHTLAAGSSSPD